MKEKEEADSFTNEIDLFMKEEDEAFCKNS